MDTLRNNFLRFKVTVNKKEKKKNFRVKWNLDSGHSNSILYQHNKVTSQIYFEGYYQYHGRNKNLCFRKILYILLILQYCERHFKEN